MLDYIYTTIDYDTDSWNASVTTTDETFLPRQSLERGADEQKGYGIYPYPEHRCIQVGVNAGFFFFLIIIWLTIDQRWVPVKTWSQSGRRMAWVYLQCGSNPSMLNYLVIYIVNYGITSCIHQLNQKYEDPESVCVVNNRPVLPMFYTDERMWISHDLDDTALSPPPSHIL